jgi:hypothetical protein
MSELSKSIMDLLRKMPELFSCYGYSPVGSMSTPKLTLMPVSSSPTAALALTSGTAKRKAKVKKTSPLKKSTATKILRT